MVIVTGGVRGLGRDISLYLASIGYDIIATYNHSGYDDIISLEKEIKDMGRKVYTFKLDVCDDLDIHNFCEFLEEEDFILDALINNAGIAIDSLYEDKTRENFLKTLNTNLVGTFMLSKKIGDMMYEKKSGVIINLSSNNSINKYFPMSLDYDASKAGVNSLTHNLAVEYAPYIRVNAVAPGFIKTPNEIKDLNDEFIKSEEDKIFVGRLGEMREVSRVIAFLISDDASYINNQIIVVDGGTYGV